MSLAMSEHERQEFLAGVHVGVISIERVDGPPLTVPIWYGYEPGGLVWIITGAESLKGRLLHAARRFSLCAQTEEPPTSTSASRGRSSTWPRPSSKPTGARWRTATSARSWVTPTWPAALATAASSSRCAPPAGGPSTTRSPPDHEGSRTGGASPAREGLEQRL